MIEERDERGRTVLMRAVFDDKDDVVALLDLAQMSMLRTKRAILEIVVLLPELCFA